MSEQTPLFLRTPTNDEKLHYRVQWGGIEPWRCVTAMVGMFVIGFLMGLAL